MNLTEAKNILSAKFSGTEFLEGVEDAGEVVGWKIRRPDGRCYILMNSWDKHEKWIYFPLAGAQEALSSNAAGVIIGHSRDFYFFSSALIFEEKRRHSIRGVDLMGTDISRGKNLASLGRQPATPPQSQQPLHPRDQQIRDLFDAHPVRQSQGTCKTQSSNVR